MKPVEPVPLIEVIEPQIPIAGQDGIVKFKGKVLHPEVVTICHKEHVEVEMPAEILFDFNAGELPDFTSFGVRVANDECMGVLDYVRLSREKGYVEMAFVFIIDEETPPKCDLNPFMTLPALTESVKKKKYKIVTYPRVCGFYATFQVPFCDNVYSHYKKHLAAFEKLCEPIEKEVIKRLNKRLKSK